MLIGEYLFCKGRFHVPASAIVAAARYELDLGIMEIHSSQLVTTFPLTCITANRSNLAPPHAFLHNLNSVKKHKNKKKTMGV
jgi:hypothetical protein